MAPTRAVAAEGGGVQREVSSFQHADGRTSLLKHITGGGALMQDTDLKALFASVALPGASCVLEMGLSERGEPEDLVIVSCPNEVAHSVEKSLRRWGMRSVGAELGDGTRYRMEMRF